MYIGLIIDTRNVITLALSQLKIATTDQSTDTIVLYMC